MDIFEITGYVSGVSQAGVNYLQMPDSFQYIEDGFIYRQVLQSRFGLGFFAPRLANKTRIFGIYEFIHPDASVELLAFDQNFLYSFNTGSGIFVQKPFAGSLTLYPGFGISSKDSYISGTAYPAAQFLSDGTPNPAYINGGARFIFTIKGAANVTPNGEYIFYYNGTDVRSFTNTLVTDNPNFQNPLIAGSTAELQNAKYVVFFGQRLNFLSPTIGSIEYTQDMIFSGIADTSGNGDKFAVAGSGTVAADTSEVINGVRQLGQVLCVNFSRSNWTIEKTTDAFNPYFIRKIPSTLGTDADFSAVEWSETVRSLGKTGIISTDGRTSLRIDNKIPRFTSGQQSSDQELSSGIDQIKFNYSYGGFDRLNNQFLWTYIESESGELTQNKVLIHNYEENSWSVNNQRLTVFGQSDLGLNKTWDEIDETSGNESWATWDTTDEIWDRIGLGEAVQKTLAGDDLGFIYELNRDFSDYFADISNITNAPQAVLTISESGFKKGDKVIIQGVQGMVDIHGESINNFDPSITDTDFQPYILDAAIDTSVTLTLDTQQFTPYVPVTGSISKVISFYAEMIPFNPYRSVGRKCFISHVEFLIDNNGGYLFVDVYEDEEEEAYKGNILLLPDSDTKARQYIVMEVNNEANFHTFVLRQENPSSQLRLTSIRIHCRMGGLSNG